MSQQLLRRAWGALDTFKQAYPENWHKDDQQVLDDLMKADLDLSGAKRQWVGLTDDEYFVLQMKIKTPMISVQDYIDAMRMVEAELKQKNT